MGVRGRERAHRLYDWDTVALQYESLCFDVLHAARGRAADGHEHTHRTALARAASAAPSAGAALLSFPEAPGTPERSGPSVARVNGRTGSGLRVLAICDRPPSVGNRASDGNTLISREVLVRIAPECRLTLAWFHEDSRAPDPELLRRCDNAIALSLSSRLMGAMGLVSAIPMSVSRRSGDKAVEKLVQACARRGCRLSSWSSGTGTCAPG